MILGIAGVTGIGKSYYTNKIVEDLNFERVKIITTRQMREGEKNFEDKIFVNQETLQKLQMQGEIAFQFELAGNTYAYPKAELFADKNRVFELHYDTIFEFKKICPNLQTIYLLPREIEICKTKVKQRNLAPEVEQARILEMEEHYQKITSDENLRNKFDEMIYNEYNEATDQKVLEVIQKMMKHEKP